MSELTTSSAHVGVRDGRHSMLAIFAGIACAFGTMVSYTPIIVLTFPMFLKPISAEFGWGRATLSGVLLVAGLAGAVASPFAGRAVDRWGARAVVLPGSLLFALGVMLLAAIGRSATLLYVVFFLLGIIQVAPGPIAYNKVVSAWFTKKRGLALGVIVGAAMSIGNGSAPQVARVLIAEYGWRHAYFFLGLIALSCFPVMWALLREPDRSARSKAVLATHHHEGMNLIEAVHTIHFWLLIAVVACFWLAINGFRVHVVALLTDRGQSALLAGTVLSVWSVGAFFGHIVMGDVLDRVNSPRIVVPFFVSALCGLLILDHINSAAALMTGAALIGLGMGAEVTLAPYLIARFFGLRAAAEIYAYVTLCTGLAGAAGPYLMGLSFDSSHSYRLGLNAAAAILLACAIMTSLFGRYVYAPEERH